MLNSRTRYWLSRRITRAMGFSLTALMATELISGQTQAQTLPADAKPTCVVTAPVFDNWFESGHVSLNGIVKPANSVTFPDVPNCSFYQWSEQMFMWLTSPASISSAEKERIFNSPEFFSVSLPDQNRQRTFIEHKPGLINDFSLRAAQEGPSGFPVILSKSGRLLEIAPPQFGLQQKPLIRDKTGQLIEIDRSTIGEDKKPVFFDRSGKKIEYQLTPADELHQKEKLSDTHIVREFNIDGHPVFLDQFGDVIDTEEGQAGGGQVVQAQNGSLVYYISMVNDVFAYFRTGTVNGGITPPPNQFPTSQADLGKITAYASAHGKTFHNPNALAVEVKLAWVEASGLADQDSYIKMTAVIPTFDKSNPNRWTPNGQKTAELALIGIHVVGSAAGHPEMIWATFEHNGNTPNETFTYTDTSNLTKTVPRSTAGTWLFSASNSVGPFNIAKMKFRSPDIVSFDGQSNGPTDTLRSKPWGAASDVSPNPIAGSTTASNTEIISINNSVRSMIPNGDVRANYIMHGATWTIGGAPPDPGSTNQVGTSKLTNSTMETFQQGSDSTAASGSTNCFSCHESNATSVSHFFPKLKPLF